MHSGNQKDGEHKKKDTGSEGDVESRASQPSHQRLDVSFQIRRNLLAAATMMSDRFCFRTFFVQRRGKIPVPSESLFEFVGRLRSFCKIEGPEHLRLYKHRVPLKGLVCEVRTDVSER